MPNPIPLQYKIDSWRQLPRCLSNNDRNLRIHITDLFNNDYLRGFRITVDHPAMGIVFACVLQARGTLVTPADAYSEGDMSPETILAELHKFGFYITFEQRLGLSGEQLEYLKTLNGLGYDKIRIVSAWDPKSQSDDTFVPVVVAFQASPLSEWLYNTYNPSYKEYSDAILSGIAINISAISETKQYRWDWLKDSVESIDDIIRDNADDMIVTSAEQEKEDIGIDDSGLLPAPGGD